MKEISFPDKDKRSTGMVFLEVSSCTNTKSNHSTMVFSNIRNRNTMSNRL
jgi:hypothetical protein